MIGALFNLARPLIHKLDAETAHRMTVAALAAAPPLRPAADNAILATQAFGLSFSNPIGLAAGFDPDTIRASVPQTIAQKKTFCP